IIATFLRWISERSASLSRYIFAILFSITFRNSGRLARDYFAALKRKFAGPQGSFLHTAPLRCVRYGPSLLCDSHQAWGQRHRSVLLCRSLEVSECCRFVR